MKRWHGPICPIQHDDEVVQIWIGTTTQELIAVTDHWNGDIDEDNMRDGFNYDDVSAEESSGAVWISVERFPFDERRPRAVWESEWLPAPDGERFVERILKSAPEQLGDLDALVQELTIIKAL